MVRLQLAPKFIQVAALEVVPSYRMEDGEIFFLCEVEKTQM